VLAAGASAGVADARAGFEQPSQILRARKGADPARATPAAAADVFAAPDPSDI
jgi:hypothetical protein